ncbi:universal stress protein [Pelagibacterium flavum]|uniref:Universal stress protein n=1 Tax=Pelagibacterium flavum TaxID=2984530 RepID=A0ABY6IJG0_9HYPH|nr:universal stress protein [Pelagibacterium sp. YIM 151497]MAN78520.1 universal stress protein UspA [Hyphomicrobiales bacterium]UYQ70703.1 universal stress protein [Pelagibacterium sp. YIM 151497]|tara:strand:- start:1160 stop:1594 length:435 start_codon:yes stop_codon:yes gene_type:complete
MYKHILIATDGSELATKGLDQGLKLAKQLGSKVTVITVTDMWASGALAVAGPTSIAEYDAAMHAAVKDILEEAARFASETGVQCETRHIANRYPADAIVEVSQEMDVDLIVMASHGRRGFRKMLLGSQTTEVLTSSTVPVLVVR